MDQSRNAVQDVRDRRRFELVENGQTAFADYVRREGVLVIPHVESPLALRGQGTAARLMEGICEIARANGEKIRPLCSYAAAFLHRRKEFKDLLA